MSKELGQRIKDRLDSIGMTQRTLADKSGLTEVTVSRYISGEREPKAKTLAKMAEVMNTTTDYLVGTKAPEKNDMFHCNKCGKACDTNHLALEGGSAMMVGFIYQATTSFKNVAFCKDCTDKYVVPMMAKMMTLNMDFLLSEND